MASRIRRYSRDKYLRGGTLRATSTAMRLIRQRIINGRLPFHIVVTKEDDRLDHLAAKHLGDPKLWWVLAATSGIGWGLQVPAGITIKIPNSISEIKGMVG